MSWKLWKNQGWGTGYTMMGDSDSRTLLDVLGYRFAKKDKVGLVLRNQGVHMRNDEKQEDELTMLICWP
jgi:hypothetical protein